MHFILFIFSLELFCNCRSIFEVSCSNSFHLCNSLKFFCKLYFIHFFGIVSFGFICFPDFVALLHLNFSYLIQFVRISLNSIRIHLFLLLLWHSLLRLCWTSSDCGLFSWSWFHLSLFGSTSLCEFERNKVRKGLYFVQLHSLFSVFGFISSRFVH